MVEFIFTLELICTLILVGVIWTIQLVHYPSFVFVKEEDFVSFESHHTFNISLIVIPLMIVELIAAVFLVFLNSEIIFWVNLLLLVFIWCVTFFLSVPCHKVLSVRKCIKTINRLVFTNWFRTIAWTLKGILLLSSV